MPADCTKDIIDHTESLARRAGSLRDQAHGMRPLLAQTYRRRASELELQAWAIRARKCGVDHPEGRLAAPAG